MKTMKKENIINGREITPDSLRGLMVLGREINEELKPILSHWDKYMGNKKMEGYVDTLRNLWFEIQKVGYACSDDIVREAFASL